jgi:hypothetical protein
MHWKSCRAKHAGNAKCKTLFPQATLVAKGKVLISARVQIQTKPCRLGSGGKARIVKMESAAQGNKVMAISMAPFSTKVA